MKITAIIVDDELLDRELLKNLINEYCPSLSIVAEASSVEEAVQQIKAYDPEVVFLDINMPKAGGFTLIDQFPERDFHIIFTTGSDEYGIRAIKAEATDYLLKPIDVDELIASEQKLAKSRRKQAAPAPKLLKIFTNGEHLLVSPHEIVCLEAEGSYVKVHLANSKPMIVSKNLKQVMLELDEKTLKRVHRSFVVNTNHILRYQIAGNEIKLYLTNEVLAKASRKYKTLLKGIVL